MKPKHQRALFLLLALALVGGAATLALRALEQNIIYFVSPSDMIADGEPMRHVRLGGLVEYSSVLFYKTHTEFAVSDNESRVVVHYKGDLPALFREGQGVVAEGHLQEDGVFFAERILAKHDENYMPPEVAKSLKEQGHWKDQYGKE